MKNISPALATHLKQQVTTLCTCIVIRRRDTKSFHFTDHDIPLFYANQIYTPQDSFARFSISSSIDLDVDILEIKGMINSSTIARDDIAAGLFDWAQINVFVINYMAPEMGRVMLRSGHLGEFTMDEDGTFRSEIRGVSQVYASKIGSIYQAECRADLGDRRCRVPLIAPTWQPSQGYCINDVVSATINPALGYVNLGLTNNSFESDGSVDQMPALEGWTTYGDTGAGQWGTFTGTAFGSVAASRWGTYYAGHRNYTDPLTHITAHSVDLGMYQDIDMVLSGITTGDLDSGQCRLVVSVWVARANSSNTYSQVRVFALDAAGAQFATVYDSGNLAFAEDLWVEQKVTDVLIPTGTRKLRFDLFSHKEAGNFAGNGFDYINAAVNTPSGSLGSSNQNGGVAFKAMNGGVSGTLLPAFSNLIGSTTIDNNITWLCVPAFGTTATVTAISSTNPRVFTPSTLPGGSGYYDGGFLTWETGMNAGIVQEVFASALGTIRLFIRPFHRPQIGDRFTIHPGCDKTRATCGSKFSNVANFRGEPDVPGMDEYMKIPNADGGTQFFFNAGA